MKETTLTELRNHVKDYFDAVEGGSTVRVFRNGRPIAEIVPVRSEVLSWKQHRTPLTIKGLSLGLEILADRDELA
ncbi:type II toxin-antitoxin system Phd/YefM family antitoxin [Acidiferrobacter sp.]|uniref:type II toxin-antitoxin system Phd/YefM family antitoxin n=1 Tax=Acidiferrobacter sp. TaxID=1872107 RepID=UPI00262E7C89|nr:type II toxin-antitoxin system Phd/YefM family antitoxin [Acidiferrobacter sp.]